MRKTIATILAVTALAFSVPASAAAFGGWSWLLGIILSE